MCDDDEQQQRRIHRRTGRAGAGAVGDAPRVRNGDALVRTGSHDTGHRDAIASVCLDDDEDLGGGDTGDLVAGIDERKDAFEEDTETACDVEDDARVAENARGGSFRETSEVEAGRIA